MHNLSLHILKTLAVLAVLVVPLQQSLLSACCCDHGQGSLQQTSHTSARCCTSQEDAGCRGSDHSCCQRTETEPCRCPRGCCNAQYPSTIELTPSETLSPVELSDTFVPAVMLDLPVMAKVALRAKRSDKVSFSGAKLCALLCRFTL